MGVLTMLLIVSALNAAINKLDEAGLEDPVLIYNLTRLTDLQAKVRRMEEALKALKTLHPNITSDAASNPNVHRMNATSSDAASNAQINITNTPAPGRTRRSVSDHVNGTGKEVASAWNWMKSGSGRARSSSTMPTRS